MKQTLLILAMSSIVAYGQEKTTLGYNGKPAKPMTLEYNGKPAKAVTAEWKGDSAIDERTRRVKSLYHVPITFGEYKQPKYKDLFLKTTDGMAIEWIKWGLIDSTLSIRLIDSNEKPTTMKYKLIETK